MNNNDLLNKSKPLLIFDGSCAFCRSCIRFVKKYDIKLQFDFADNNQNTTKLILAQYFINPESLNSVVLIEYNKLHIQSDAIIKALLLLGGRWKILARIMMVFPNSFRNKVYNIIAANRNKLRIHCRV